MDISEKTFKDMTDTNDKLNVLFDISVATYKKAETAVDHIEGTNGAGLSERVRTLEKAHSRIKKILLGGISTIATLLGVKPWV